MILSKKNIVFWKKNLNLLIWKKKPKIVFERKKDNSFRWYTDGKISLYNNLIIQNVKKNKNKKAIITLSKNHEVNYYTYKQIDDLVNIFHNNLFLYKKKIKKVMIHSSASIDSAVSMLSCIRAGIFFSVIFEELPENAISTRIKLFKPDIFITKKKGIYLNLKKKYKNNLKILNFEQLKKKNNKLVKKNVAVDSNRDFFCLFTSGSTGEPKGVVHSYGGYSVFTKFTCKKQFGMNKNSTVLTASDAGWINGHTYSLFGPLLFGATTILCEKPLILLNLKTFKKILNLGVDILYLPVTLIRLMKTISKSINFKSKKIKTIGSMGEPLAPSIGTWYAKNFKNNKSAIVNTYFQTETGGIIFSPKHTDTSDKKPHGSVGNILTKSLQYNKLSKVKKKEVLITQPWPGCMKKLLNRKKEWDKYWTKDKNFRMFDLATEKNNTVYIHGRIDDVINIRGHRIGSEELESVVLKNKNISECCAVSSPDIIEGNIFYLFVVSKNEKIDNNINNLINSVFGSFALPKKIYYLPELPKTRSGKILRRLLRNLLNKEKNIGDISTMLNPNILKIIRKKLK